MSRNRFSVSRREAMGWFGGVLTLSPLIFRNGFGAAQNSAQQAEALFRPLQAGQRFEGFVIEAILPLKQGAASLRLRSDEGQAFELEVLARDTKNPLSPKPPGETKLFAVYLKNGGDGWLPTAEAQGLCAMALSELIAKNEKEPLLEGFLTHGERFEQHRASLLAPTNTKNTNSDDRRS